MCIQEATFTPLPCIRELNSTVLSEEINSKQQASVKPIIIIIIVVIIYCLV